MQGLKMSLVHLVSILAAPTEVFTDLLEHPKWLHAFLLLSILSIGVAWAYNPIADHFAYIQLSGRFSEREIEYILARGLKNRYINLIFIPLRFLAKWILTSCLLFFLFAFLETKDVKFKAIYVVVVYSEIVLLLASIINLLLLHIKGIENLHQITDLQAVVGLDILLPDKRANLPLFTLLNSVNVFSIWYLATLTIGISIATNFSKLKAGALVTSVWLLGVGFQVALTAISSNFSAAMGG